VYSCFPTFCNRSQLDRTVIDRIDRTVGLCERNSVLFDDSMQVGVCYGLACAVSEPSKHPICPLIDWILEVGFIEFG